MRSKAQARSGCQRVHWAGKGGTIILKGQGRGQFCKLKIANCRQNLEAEAESNWEVRGKSETGTLLERRAPDGRGEALALVSVQVNNNNSLNLRE